MTLILPRIQTGEIDIIEGVPDQEHNQVTWHTGPSKLGSFISSLLLPLIDSISYARLFVDTYRQLHWDGCGMDISLAVFVHTSHYFPLSWEQTGNPTWTATAACREMQDAALLNGVVLLTVPPSMHREAACSQ